MPITDHPLISFDDNIYRPYLKIRIINSHTGNELRTYGIVDTGADKCAIPASFAPIQGHDLQAGSTKQVMTGNGSTIAYSHTTQFEIFHPYSDQALYSKNRRLAPTHSLMRVAMAEEKPLARY